MKMRYVYYNKNGAITDILNIKKRGRAPYVECAIEEVEGFMSGTKGINQYIVVYDNDLETHSLIKKNNIIMFRKQSKILYKIPYKKTAESDLRLIYYSDNVLEITLDVSKISPLYRTNFRDTVRFEKGTEIRILIKEKGSNNLLKELIIDAQTLLESGQMFFKLYSNIQSNNVEFFTYETFTSYSWYKGNMRLISPINDSIKFEIHKADHKIRSKDFSYHLIVTPSKTGVKIKNNIESLKLIKFHKNIEFFLVDRHDPNILYDKFFLDKKDLKSKEILVDLKMSIKGKTILYNNKYISVLVEG